MHTKCGYKPFSVAEEVASVGLVKVVPDSNSDHSGCGDPVCETDQCFAGFSLNFCFSSSGTGALFCLLSAAEMTSS